MFNKYFGEKFPFEILGPWLPGSSGTRLGQQLVTASHASVRLRDWIDEEARTWREDRVRAALSQEEAEVVLQIPIPMEQSHDTLIWPFERGGSVTVRFAYHFI